MPPIADIVRAQRLRELEHWRMATERLGDLETLAPASAWDSLEHYVGIALRHALSAAVARLRSSTERLRVDGGDLVELRAAYARTEATLDFFADALATRANPPMARLLRACDHLATRGMAEVLVPLGRQVPSVVTYLDRGLGASILKAGLRLWEPTLENPVAAIKVVRHNVLRPCAVLHEAGHQVAYQLGWNDELAHALFAAVSEHSVELAHTWAGWASEIAGDCYAFVHVGYAAVVSLRDVVAGAAFHWLPDDPHPIAYLRVLLGIEMCRTHFGAGPWDDLAAAWLAEHPLALAPLALRPLLAASVELLPRIVDTCLSRAYPAFGGRSLRACVDPMRVSPASLAALDRDAGKAALASAYWIWNESIRLLALTGYRTGLGPEDVREGLIAQHTLMNRLGDARANRK